MQVLICPLCRVSKKLRNSHLIPKAAYALVRSSYSANPNPIASGDDYLYPTSRQLSKDFLCGECEDSLSKRGETWVMAKCSRGEEGFALREFLLEAHPYAAHENIRTYEASIIPEIDCDK